MRGAGKCTSRSPNHSLQARNQYAITCTLQGLPVKEQQRPGVDEGWRVPEWWVWCVCVSPRAANAPNGAIWLYDFHRQDFGAKQIHGWCLLSKKNVESLQTAERERITSGRTQTQDFQDTACNLKGLSCYLQSTQEQQSQALLPKQRFRTASSCGAEAARHR